MNELPLWASVPASVLLVAGGLLTLVGSVGLLRLPDFFTRMHAPAMGNTLGVGCTLVASILISSALARRPVIHEMLITLCIVMTSPVTAMFLMRAAVYRGDVRRQQSPTALLDGLSVRPSGDTPVGDSPRAEGN